MDENKIVTDIMLSVHKDVGTMKADVAEIKVDLREHMRRTHMLETEMKWLRSQVWLAKGGIALLAILGTLAGIAKLFV